MVHLGSVLALQTYDLLLLGGLTSLRSRACFFSPMAFLCGTIRFFPIVCLCANNRLRWRGFFMYDVVFLTYHTAIPSRSIGILLVEKRRDFIDVPWYPHTVNVLWTQVIRWGRGGMEGDHMYLYSLPLPPPPTQPLIATSSHFLLSRPIVPVPRGRQLSVLWLVAEDG
jgi:hypothetical protein